MNKGIQYKDAENDRNFDDLAHRFQRKVYGGLKSLIRLEVLKKDLGEFCPRALMLARNRPLKILDAGGGHGPFSIFLAELGHRVTLCDISEKMLFGAGQAFSRAGLAEQIEILHCPIQELKSRDDRVYDLVLCHAVLEWVRDPRDLIRHLMEIGRAHV